MQKANILIVEDDPAIATVIRVAVSSEGGLPTLVDTIASRDRMLSNGTFDALVTDVMLPDGNGLDGLAERVEAGELPPVIVLSAQNTLDTAVRATEGGAFDYLPKPFDLDELLASIRAAVRRKPNAELSPPTVEEAHSDLPIIGRDAAMQEVYRTIARVSPTDLSVLILGESGTGKELVAHSIHRSSRRRSGPFVAVNMAAIPRELIESELFGHEKGAFTGALAKASGRFEQARGGTLFLDEIGDMPFEAQTRLLRVLQDGDYTPVGAARSVRADVRIVAATNQNLAELVSAGRFREDLYYRLNVIPLSLPALRERRSDVPLLAKHFLAQAANAGLPLKSLSESAAEMLSEWHWPGNVRELGNVIQRLMLLTRSDQIEGADVADVLRLVPQTGEAQPNFLPAGNADVELERAVRRWLQSSVADAAAKENELFSALVSRVERLLISNALERTKGNQLRAANLLGINRNTLRQKRQD